MMVESNMTRPELIRKLRSLKKQEVKIRFTNRQNFDPSKLVWHQFFSVDDHKTVTYPLRDLLKMTHDERKLAFGSFFFSVYYVYYGENGLPIQNLFSKVHLEVLGLMPGATEEEIKRRFRLLAKEHHPDKGGNAQIFMEILEAYEALTTL